MRKFNAEFKEKIVLEYLNGNTSYRILSEKYNLNSLSLIREWVKLYSASGIEGLKRRKAIRRYSVQFKLDAVKYMVEMGSTSLETAIQFKINNSGIVRKWYKEFYGQGVEGLRSVSKGQSPMSNKPKKHQQKKNGKPAREQQLEREIDLKD